MLWPALEHPLIVEALGVLAFVIIVLTYQCNRRSHILYTHAFGMGLLATHLALIGAEIGAALMGANMVRNLIFSQKHSWRWARSRVVLHVTAAVIVALAAASWEGLASWFAVTAALIGTYAVWFDNPRYIRRFTLVSACIWFPYAWLVGSTALIFVQSFLIISILIATWRFDRVNMPVPTTTFRGVVEHGDGYGRQLGFPTINIDRAEYLKKNHPLAHGVYAGSVTILSKNKTHPAAIVIGPVDDTGNPKLEAHLIDFEGDLYGELVKFRINMHLRPLITYHSEMALRLAIQEDINHIRDRNLAAI